VLSPLYSLYSSLNDEDLNLGMLKSDNINVRLIDDLNSGK
jgi:hypothetical protein